MNCQSVKEKLSDYHEGKLSLSDYQSINNHISDCDGCAKTLDGIVNKEVIKNDNVAPASLSAKKKSRFVVAIIIFALVSAIVIEGFVGTSGLFEKFRASSQDEFGEVVDIQTESNNIRFSITHVAASEEETILYYEIKDLDAQYHFFIDAFSMEIGEKDIWVNDGYSAIRRPFNTEKEAKGVSKGRIYLPPIREEQEKVTVHMQQFFHLNSKDIKQYSEEWNAENNRTYVQGDWQVDVPIKKYEAKIFELNETLEVEGIAVEVDRLTFSPTSTVLTINYHRDQSNQHNREIQISHLKANGKRYEVNRYRWDPNSGKDVFELSVYFDGVYFNPPKEVEIHFGQMTQYVANQVKIDFDVTNTPFTFEYLGELITIETVEVGNPTRIVVAESFHENRAYNDLNPDFSHYRFSEGTLYDVNNYSVGIFVDKDGNQFKDRSESASPGDLLYYSMEHHVEVQQRDGDTPFIPTYLYIEGYTKETILDDHVRIKLGK